MVPQKDRGLNVLKLARITTIKGEVHLPVSKSLVNRLLVLQAHYPQITLPKFKEVDDISSLKNALQSKNDLIDLGAAGTAMRFATAHFASTYGREVVLTGSQRMHQRPISDLVNALQSIGADIQYSAENGFPPLKIHGAQLNGGKLELATNVSSQFASALLLVAPTFTNGLELSFTGDVVSRPYINMTIRLMQRLGFDVLTKEECIQVSPQRSIPPIAVSVENDWSAASFWYGWVALAEKGELFLTGLHQDSLQGDERIADIFAEFGVRSTFTEQGVKLEKRTALLPNKLVINLVDNPDLAQPIAFTCAALGIGADLRGLQTLPTKETDRLKAMQTELAKVGVQAVATERSIAFDATVLQQPVEPFNTYEDHRMAMAISLLASRFEIALNNPQVVSKSYPNYWADVEQACR